MLIETYKERYALRTTATDENGDTVLFDVYEDRDVVTKHAGDKLYAPKTAIKKLAMKLGLSEVEVQELFLEEETEDRE